MTVKGSAGAAVFRSKDGAGEWVHCETLDATNIGNGIRLKTQASMAADIQSKGWKGQVPALGILIRGTIARDHVAANPDLFLTKLGLGSFFDCSMEIAQTAQKYSQDVFDLGRLHYIHQAINARAANLDRRFYDDDQNMIAPVYGMDEPGVIIPDVTVGGTDQKFLATRKYDMHTALDFRAYWRQLEGRVQIRSATAGTQDFAFLYSLPLCYGTAYGLKADSIPLGTLCDTVHQTVVRVKQNRQFEGQIVHSSHGGSVTLADVSLYAYVMHIRDEDPSLCGRPYQITSGTIAQSEIVLPQGELVLFHGNIPRRGDTVASNKRTVGGDDYVVPLVYPNINADFAEGNSLEYSVGNTSFFPPNAKRRSPRRPYEQWWNASAQYGGMERPFIRTGRYSEVTTIAGADASAFLGYSNRIDTGAFSTLLDHVCAAPVRVLSMTALDLDGVPGVSALDKGCGAPVISLTGTWNLGDNVSSLKQTVTVTANIHPADVTRLQDSGVECCSKGLKRWVSVHKDPTNGRAQALMPYLPSATDESGGVAAAAGMTK